MRGNQATVIPVRPGLVLAVVNWYTSRFDLRKPPLAAAGMLAQIIELHILDLPFPKHRAIAESVGCTIWAIHTALNTTQCRGVIVEHVRTIEGNVEQRASSIKQSFYVPCEELKALIYTIPKASSKRIPFQSYTQDNQAPRRDR